MFGRSSLGNIAYRAGLAAGLALALPARGEEPMPAPPPSAPTALPSRSVEDRLKRLEETNRQLLDQYRALSERGSRERAEADQRYRTLEQRYEELKARVDTPAPAAAVPALPPPATEPSRSIADQLREAAPRGPSAAQPEAPAGRPLLLWGNFSEGFALESPDDEYTLHLHILDQTDFKNFIPNNQSPARSGLYIPRARVYFEGRLTRPFEYELSLQRSIDGVWDLLDANLNYRPSDRLQVKFGRTLTPYSFEWFDHLEQYFIAPERSLFPLNFGLARQAGLLAHGFLADGRVQYAVGGFDGHLVGVTDNNTSTEAVGYFNIRPFLLREEGALFKNLNLGGSIFGGLQTSLQSPLPMRTSLQSAENDEDARGATSIFLRFNEDAYYLGPRRGGALHLAWYGRGFSFESEYQHARFNMARREMSGQTTVPVTGFNLTLGYFLTGEVIDRRTTVYPLRPFDPRNGSWGPGAFEVFARYSQLALGDVIFTNGLADERDWSARAQMLDLGLNWYLNPYIKFYIDWQHLSCAKPILLNPTTPMFGRYNDMFWVRCQIYF